MNGQTPHSSPGIACGARLSASSRACQWPIACPQKPRPRQQPLLLLLLHHCPVLHCCCWPPGPQQTQAAHAAAAAAAEAPVQRSVAQEQAARPAVATDWSGQHASTQSGGSCRSDWPIAASPVCRQSRSTLRRWTGDASCSCSDTIKCRVWAAAPSNTRTGSPKMGLPATATQGCRCATPVPVVNTPSPPSAHSDCVARDAFADDGAQAACRSAAPPEEPPGMPTCRRRAPPAPG